MPRTSSHLSSRNRRAVARSSRESDSNDLLASSSTRPPQPLSMEKIGLAYEQGMCFENLPLYDFVGEMIYECRDCRAMKFKEETKGFCCHNGQIRASQVPLPLPPPEPIAQLTRPLTQQEISRRQLQNFYLKYSVALNSIFSIACHVDSSSPSRRRETNDRRSNFFPPGGVQTYRANGQVYSMIGSAVADEGVCPSFMQVIFLPPDAQVDTRMDVLQRIISNSTISLESEKALIADLTSMVLDHNSLITQFRTEFEQSIPNEQFMFRIRSDLRIEGVHPGRTNAQSDRDCGAAFIDNNHGDNSCDIVIMKTRTGEGPLAIRIPSTHAFYEPATFPLLFTNGETGYSSTMRKYKPDGSLGSKVSPNQHAKFLAQVRPRSHNHLLNSGNLTLQWFAVTAAKINQMRLDFIEHNQSSLRSDTYASLLRVIENDHFENLNEIGRKILLPATFSGSPRHLREYQQDCLAYVRRHGTPSLFVTFTANPAWPEIQRHVPEHLGGAHYRPDIVARVFDLKLKAFEKLIKNKKIFGEVIAYVWSIEWQKRGLPHAHILIWLKDRIRIQDVDKYITAEIPDESDIRYRTNINQVIHGPCGTDFPNSPCMVDNKCVKGFPKPFINETHFDAKGFVHYRRRSPANGGNFIKKRIGNREVELDNRWVVPHNSFHLNFQQAHVCYEVCGSSVNAIKYLFKYIFKGTDSGLAERLHTVPQNDEVKQYYAIKYISASEGAWMIYNKARHVRSHPVERLPVHVENCQNITFRSDNASQLISQIIEPKDTKLTAFFKLCNQDIFARTLLYSEVPEYFTWSVKDRCWNPRRRGEYNPETDVYKTNAFGRIYTVSPNAGEWYYLRLLLLHVRGPRSFNHIRTVNGILCQTYHEACLELHFLESDMNWEETLEEASICAMPFKQRKLFAIMLCYCSLSNPVALWMKFREIMCDDFIRQYRLRNNIDFGAAFTEDQLNICYNQGLNDLNTLCAAMTSSRLSDFGMPMPALNLFVHSSLPIPPTDENDDALFQTMTDNINNLTVEQREFFDLILNKLRTKRGGVHLLKASGGTGKTFLLNTILAKTHFEKYNVVACASSGIAATNLSNGRTAHSVFRIPLTRFQDEQVICSINSSSPRGRFLKTLDLIVWDEVSASHKSHIDAVSNTMKDLKNSPRPFGGVLVIFAGDYRQTLPVVKRATPTEQTIASIKFSRIWNLIYHHSLTLNMRVHLNNALNTTSDRELALFAQQLLQLGEDLLSTDPLPANFYTKTDSLNELIEKVYPEFESKFKDTNWLKERCILAPRNDSVEEINLKMLEKIPENELITIYSYDVLDESESSNANLFPIEFLNSITPSGFPPHQLKLKVGCPVILLRNIDPPRLCNGTRLIVEHVTHNLLTAKIITGIASGEIIYIPRLRLVDEEDTFKFTRTQFPVRLSFAMTINKSQGQTMSSVGIDLSAEQCFSHGQLYVACSRVGTPQGLFINHIESIRNVVYPSAFWD